jgi:predicted site-specific integrase-resolvase
MNKVIKVKVKSERPVLPRMAYSLRETAQLLGVCYQTVWRMQQKGLLHPCTGLRHKLIPKSEIERFLNTPATKE